MLDGPRNTDAGQVDEYVRGRIEGESYCEGAKTADEPGEWRGRRWKDGSMGAALSRLTKVDRRPIGATGPLTE